MKLFREVTGFAYLATLFVSMFSASPVSATGTCVPQSVLCASITVTLSKTPTAPATVTATRAEAGGIGDDQFTLTVDPKNNAVYHSGFIANSGNDSPACQTLIGQQHDGWRKFNIKVTGSASGQTSSPVDVCINGSRDYKVSINVTVAGTTSQNGSMSGLLQYKGVPAGNIIPCTTGDQINITGPNNFKKTVAVIDAKGHFQTDKSLPPGSGYAIDALCINKDGRADGSYKVDASGITINKNQNTDIKTITGTGVGSASPTPSASPDPSAVDPEAPCDGASGPYAWILCPAVTKADEFLTNAYKELIVPLLQIDPLTTAKDNGTFIVWKSFVSLANILFVLAFLGIIFGTVLNLDAYTVKKALPRLVIAAIAVQISYFVCGVLIDISNIFGNGLLDFITHAVTLVPIPGQHVAGSNAIESTLSYGAAALITGAFVYAAFLGPAVALFIIGFVISAFTFIITLLVRKLLITTLIILAPIAFVAWILPNTESLFKKWKDNFLKMLFIFPIMSVLVGSSYIVQVASRGAGNSAIGQIIGGIAPMIAFFMMPAVFKMSGQALSLATKGLSRAGNWANKKASDRTEKAYDNSALLKQRQEKKLIKNLGRAQGTGLRARMAQSKAGFGMARTSGAMSAAFSKLDGIEKTNQAGAARQIRDANADDALAIMATQVGKEALLSNGKKLIVSEAAKKAAVDKAAQSRDTATLEKMKGAAVGADAAIFDSALRASSAFSSIYEKAPHLAGGGYGKLSASQISDLNGTGMAEFQKQVLANPTTVGANAQQAFAQLRNAPALKAKIAPENQAILNSLGADLDNEVSKSHDEAIEINKEVDRAKEAEAQKATNDAAEDARTNAMLDEHMNYLLSQGESVTREQLKEKLSLDPDFKHQFETAKMNNIPIRDVPSNNPII